ncbi:ABC transporter permease [Candidatus Atribacteria bacterium HGW-Atribacteria-1]|nr:MAG: ABC transporter permease [Candidatus Atribacteria bacterium HGW-Atribacteria-1]
MSVINALKKFTLEQVKKDYTPYIILSIPLLFLALFLLWPLGMSIGKAFVLKGQELILDNYTLANFQRFFTSSMYQRSLRNSFVISFSVVFFTLLIGAPMGYFVARVEMPFKKLILSLGILPIITPAFVGAFSWVILLGRQGVVRYAANKVLGLVGLSLPPIYGLFGIIFTMSLTYLPFVFLLSYGAFKSTNPLLEESAMIMGAGHSRILRTITIPLILPSLGAAAILVFIRAIGNFGIPAVLGGQQYVLPTLIHFRVHGFWDLNGASAIAIISVAIVIVALIIQKKVVSAREYETISTAASEYKLHRHPLIKTIAILYCSLVLIISLAPQITIITMSFFTKWIGFLPTGFTLENYKIIPQIASKTIKNSLFLATSASLLTALIGTLAAYITERRRPKGAMLIDFTIMTPFVLPGIVVSVALLSAFSSGPINISGTFLIIIISFMVRRTPYVFRSVAASLTQLDEALEESSTISGASWFYTFRRITFPLILPGIIAGAILTFATLLQELSTTILLYSARTQTLPIQIYNTVAEGDFGIASALSVLLIVTVFIMVYLMNIFLGDSGSSSFKLG